MQTATILLILSGIQWLSFVASNAACTFERGNVLQDQVCSTDPFYEEVQNLSQSACVEYAATGRAASLPSVLLKEETCLFEVTRDVLPNWIRLMYGGEYPCVLELAFEAARNDYTKESDLRSEHLPYQLLVDNNVDTRLNLSNNKVRNVIPNSRGSTVEELFKEDFRLHNSELDALQGGNTAKYIEFLWHHIVSYALEVIALNGSGARSILRSVAPFSSKSYLRMKLGFEFCTWKAGAWSLFDAHQARPSEEFLESALRAKVSQAKFAGWQQWKELLQNRRPRRLNSP